MPALYNYANVLRAGELDIKSARLKAGMTQKELGKLLGVTKQTIINYEKGTTEPSWERLEDIAKALKIDAVSYTHLDVYKRQPDTLAVFTIGKEAR